MQRSAFLLSEVSGGDPGAWHDAVIRGHGNGAGSVCFSPSALWQSQASRLSMKAAPTLARLSHACAVGGGTASSVS